MRVVSYPSKLLLGRYGQRKTGLGGDFSRKVLFWGLYLTSIVETVNIVMANILWRASALLGIVFGYGMVFSG